MKKVVCNVLYDTKLPVMYNEYGQIVHELGLFDNAKDATIASNILARIFVRLNETLGISYIEAYDIKEVFIPEDMMNNYFIKDKLVSSLDDFVENNAIVKYFVEQNGEDSLQEITNNTIAEVNESFKPSQEDESKLSKQNS